MRYYALIFGAFQEYLVVVAKRLPTLRHISPNKKSDFSWEILLFVAHTTIVSLGTSVVSHSDRFHFSYIFYNLSSSSESAFEELCSHATKKWLKTAALQQEKVDYYFAKGF